MKKDDKEHGFRLLKKYLKHEKFKLFLYVILCFCTYTPDILCAVFVGKALECLLLKEFQTFFLYLLLYDGVYVLAYSILQIPRDYIYNTLEVNFIKNVTKDMYKKYQDMPAIAFEEMGVGELINRLYSDPDRIMELFTRIVRLVCKVITVIFVIIVSFKVSIFIGIELIIFAILMYNLATKYFPKIKETNKKIKQDTDKFVKDATENITGIREIKSLGIKDNMLNSVNKRIDSMCNESMKIRNYESFYWAFNSGLFYIVQFAILCTCGYLFVKGHIVYSVFMMIEMYLWRVSEVSQQISEFGVNLNKVKVSLNRIDEVLSNRLYEDEKFGDVELKDIKGFVEFKNVSFKYRDEENLSLNKLSLKFKPNKKIAIVGKSGNGKSTIFNLLSRFFDTKDGEILIDNVNITDLSENSLRRAISSIRQAPFLFNMSIMDNFRLVKEDVTLKEVREVCKKAYIDDYIMGLPGKYNSIIGEGGINLSGGQKQRIAIARTLLLNTKIILFDEATSALDNESQTYIKKTIDNLVKDHTIIIVAHRLSTIIDADEIFVIDKGTLVSRGTHNSLLNKSKIYRTLYMSEDKGDNNAKRKH